MNTEQMERGISKFLNSTELFDMEDQHMVNTPKRVVKAWSESFLSGYSIDPKNLMSTKFQDNCEEMVVVKNIPFTSMCAHHLLPFSGTAKIGYIPQGILIGLSKLARVLDCFAKRLQIQERLTREVAEVIQNELKPVGVGVILQAEHLCMTIRGAQKPGSITTTSCLLGAFRNDSKAREEFLSL